MKNSSFFFTTKQVSGLKIFFDIKRCAIVVNFVVGKVCSIDDDDAVFVLLIVDDDKVSSVSIVKQVCCSLHELSIILISVETINGRV
jgi:hypothetical protein